MARSTRGRRTTLPPVLPPRARLLRSRRSPDADAEDARKRKADDDEYVSEEEVADDLLDDDDDEVAPRRGLRGTRALLRPPVDDDGEGSGESDAEGGESDVEEAAAESDIEAAAESDAEVAAEEPKPKPKKFKKPPPKKRGRKKLKLIFNEDGVLDEDGNPLNVKSDEIVIDHEDPKGQAKVLPNGQLVGDRRYRMKTFTLLNNGDQLFMVSTEPARLVGFRDSYLLFKTHRTLFKKVCTHEEKMDLINRHIIPNLYKGRSVNLVSARSIFREFGARMLINGKKVIDDFWEDRAIERGDVPGEYADPAELYLNRYITSGLGMGGSAGADLGNGTPPVVNQAALASSAVVKYQTDKTWMFQIVMQTALYNRRLYEDRQQALRGLKDTYTGLSFVPQRTQPTRAVHTRLGDGGDRIVTETVYYNPDITRRATGLKDVPPDVFAEVDPDIKRAILEQQRYERT